MTSYLKILPLFMMVMPGMISRILFPGKCRRRDRLLFIINYSLRLLYGAGTALTKEVKSLQCIRCPKYAEIHLLGYVTPCTPSRSRPLAHLTTRCSECVGRDPFSQGLCRSIPSSLPAAALRFDHALRSLLHPTRYSSWNLRPSEKSYHATLNVVHCSPGGNAWMCPCGRSGARGG